MKKITALLGALLLGILLTAASCDETKPRDLDAYKCGDAQRDEDQREDDPDAIRTAGCLELFDETDADDDEEGDCVLRVERDPDDPSTAAVVEC